MKSSIYFNSICSLVLLLFSIVQLQAQKVGINTLNPTADFHVVGNSLLFEGSGNLINWNILGFESTLSTNKQFKITTPKLLLSGTNISLSPGNVMIGSTANASQKLEVNGAIKLGTTLSGTNGTLRYAGGKFQGYASGFWRDLVQEVSFIKNPGSNLIYSTNDHVSEMYDFVIGDKQLPTTLFTKKMMFFDVSKGSFRAGELDGSSAWLDPNIGDRSFAVGLNNTASGKGSFATGDYNEATADLATSFGNWNKANAVYTFVTGRYNEARSPYEMVIGRYAENYTPVSSLGWSSGDRIFTIGNGGSVNSRNNLLTIKKDGETRLDGNFLVGENEDSPSIELLERTSNGKLYSQILMRNENSLHADQMAILLGTNGSNNEPFIEMRRKDGSIGIKLDVDVAGDSRITTDELSIAGGSDFAEFFDINSTTQKRNPGMLVSIDPDNPGKLAITSEREDSKLVGIISGANGIETGMTMGQKGSIADGEFPVALSGRVYVYTNGEGGIIEPGDFLTSSSQEGYAMKANMDAPKWGSLIGKAMTRVDDNGYVLVLVNLQ